MRVKAMPHIHFTVSEKEYQEIFRRRREEKKTLREFFLIKSKIELDANFKEEEDDK